MQLPSGYPRPYNVKLAALVNKVEKAQLGAVANE